MVGGLFDVTIITETKLGDPQLEAQFCINDFSILCSLDRNRNGGGFKIFVRDDIPSKLLIKHSPPENIETDFIELNFRKCKWLLYATYRLPSQNHQYFFDNIDKSLHVYFTYESVALASDFNTQVGEKSFDIFLISTRTYFHKLQPDVFKNPNNTSYMKEFFKTETVFKGLSDFHKLVLPIFQLYFSKRKAKEILYRSFKRFQRG